jgi:hypothetical protein
VTESVALPIETCAVTSEQLPVTNKQIIVHSVIADVIRTDDGVIAEQIRANDDVIADLTDDDVIAGLTRNPIRILFKLLFFICF